MSSFLRLLCSLLLRLPPQNYFLLLKIPPVLLIHKHQVEEVPHAELSANILHGCAQLHSTQEQPDRNGLTYAVKKW